MSEKRRKRHSPEQIVRKLRDADAMLSRGQGRGGRAAGVGGERVDARALAEAVRRDEVGRRRFG